MNVPILDASGLKQLLDDPENIIVDIRVGELFADGFISGSYFLPNEEVLPDLLSIHDFNAFNKLIVIADDPMSNSMVNAIQQAFGGKVAGVLYTGKEPNWIDAGERDMVITIEPDELAMDLPFDEAIILIDVRNSSEFSEGHLTGARHFPLEDLRDPANIALIPEEGNIYLYCSNGKRSMLAASVFKKHGLHNLRVVPALWEDISTTPGLSVEKEASQLN